MSFYVVVQSMPLLENNDYLFNIPNIFFFIPFLFSFPLSLLLPSRVDVVVVVDVVVDVVEMALDLAAS